MNTNQDDKNGRLLAQAGLMPPYRVLSRFLPEVDVAVLLDYVRANERRFEDTTLRGGKIDSEFRVSKSISLSGDMKRQLRERLLALAPELIVALRVTPFKPDGIELELVAHGDGAFYERHIDTFTGKETDTERQRLLSAVYYFHSEPKSFSGGALRLYAFTSEEADAKFVDIEPVNNTLLVFPSWATHSVQRVFCPSQRFLDSRFAINCWLWRRKADNNAG